LSIKLLKQYAMDEKTIDFYGRLTRTDKLHLYTFKQFGNMADWVLLVCQLKEMDDKSFLNSIYDVDQPYMGVQYYSNIVAKQIYGDVLTC